MATGSFGSGRGSFDSVRELTDAIRRGSFTSVADLEAAIGVYIDAWNDRCQPLTWTKDADTILAKAQRSAKTQDSAITRH